MRKPPKSTVIADGYQRAIDQLKREAPEAAAVLEAEPPSLIRSVGTHPPKPTASKKGLEPVPSQPAHRKGVVFKSSHLDGPEVPAALARAIKVQGIDPSSPAAMAELGVRGFEQFWHTTIRALTQDPGHAVTPRKATGTFFEIIGWDHPVVQMRRRDLFDTLRNRMHVIAARGDSLRNGLFESEELHSPFSGPILTMENTRLVIVAGGRELHGGQWVDRLDHVTNQHRQTLGIFGDLKGIYASKDLKEQIGSLRPRLLAAIAYGGRDVFIEGTIGAKRERIRLSQFIFAEELNAGNLSRVGIKATRGETQHALEMVEDVHGEPFIRMVLHCRTDKVLRIYTSFYLELGL